MATWRAIPEDITYRLNRLNAEIARRNGYPNISTSGPVVMDGDVPMTAGGYMTPPVINTILSGIKIIKTAGVPSDVVALDSYIKKSDLDAIDAILTALEAQPRSATSNNDCANACAGMCVSQCTTTCLSTCTGGCASTCSTTCTGGCTGTCTGTCSTTCTGGCTGTCTAYCSSNCNGGCYGGCLTGCKSACALACATSCTGGCAGGNKLD